MLITQSIDRVRVYRKCHDLTIKAFARLAGMNEATIRHMDDPAWRPNSGTLMALEAVIPAGWVPPGQLPKNEEAA